MGYVHVIPVSNGSSWTLKNICADIVSKYRVARANPDFVVVWMDREKQACGSAGVEHAIRAALIKEGVDSGKVHICIPDRMTENIILADEAVIRQELGNPAYSYSSEGMNGKSVIRSLFKATNRNYKETFDGVQLLKKMRLVRCAQTSASADRFYQQVKHVNCWWI